jgi:threonine/homoserine/homoserine lactone efflux protein
MPEFQTPVLFLGAALALNPTLGIAAGCTVHITALALGLSVLLAAVPLAYDAVRWVGGAYLIALGTRALLRPAGLGGGGAVPAAPLGRVFRQGVVTNLLNPKVALFFLAFIPQFVDPARGRPAAQIVALGLLFDTSGTLVNLGVAVLASRVTGGVFVGLGLRLAVAGRH